MLSLLKLYFFLPQLHALPSFLVRLVHVLQFRVTQIGPSFSVPAFSVNPIFVYTRPIYFSACRRKEDDTLRVLSRFLIAGAQNLVNRDVVRPVVQLS